MNTKRMFITSGIFNNFISIYLNKKLYKYKTKILIFY